MRIDSSTVGMESARSYKASSYSVRKFMIREYQGELTQQNNSLNAAIGGGAEQMESEDKLSSKNSENENAVNAEDSKIALFKDWQNKYANVNNNVKLRSSTERTYNSIHEMTVRYIFEMLFAARRNRLQKWMEENNVGGGQNAVSNESNNDSNVTNIDALFTEPQPVNVRMRSLVYAQETYTEETENTSFSTQGTVRTADGREINFNVNVGMSREFQSHYSEELSLAQFNLCDPLVINLDTDVAELQDQTFFFDIDADGEMDEVSQLGSGSGYLALDKNDDGVINDGSELFGTQSGNGFSDLAKYDEDGNGWIDENDAVWNKLKIWVRDENGQDILYRLADKGVGAICLQNASTEFTQKAVSGQTLGAIRNTGIFLYENGMAGTVQHVDVAKYYKNA